MRVCNGIVENNNSTKSNGNGIIITNCDEQKLKSCYYTGICFSTFQSELHMLDIVLLQNKQNPNKHDPATSLVQHSVLFCYFHFREMSYSE